MNDRTVMMKKFAPAGLVAAGLALGFVVSEIGRPSPAIAQSSNQQIPPDQILSAGAQRDRMIAAINALGDRLGRIETKLNGPLTVKVLEMPAMKSDNK